LLQGIRAGDHIEGWNRLERGLDSIFDHGGKVAQQVTQALHRQVDRTDTIEGRRADGTTYWMAEHKLTPA
jgi:hypothetical protein